MKRIFWPLIFAAMMAGAITVHGRADTLSQIRDRIRTVINDKNSVTTKRQYSDAYLNEMINNVQFNIARVSWAIIKTTYVPTAANQREYSMPADYCTAHRVAYVATSSTTASAGVYKKLAWATPKNLDKDLGAYWEQLTGIPSHYYDETPGKIGLYPAPSTTTVYGLEVRYVALPADISISSADATVPFDGLSYMYPYHRLIEKGVLGDLGSEAARVDYYNALKDIKQVLNDSPDRAQQMNR